MARVHGRLVSQGTRDGTSARKVGKSKSYRTSMCHQVTESYDPMNPYYSVIQYSVILLVSKTDNLHIAFGIQTYIFLHKLS